MRKWYWWPTPAFWDGVRNFFGFKFAWTCYGLMSIMYIIQPSAHNLFNVFLGVLLIVEVIGWKPYDE